MTPTDAYLAAYKATGDAATALCEAIATARDEERAAVVRYLEAWAATACMDSESWAVRTVARGVSDEMHLVPASIPERAT